MELNDPAYWTKVRGAKWSSTKPPSEWPTGVRPISLHGLGLLGIHERRNTLHWDGTELETKQKISLRGLELTLAALATLGVVASAAIQVLEYFVEH